MILNGFIAMRFRTHRLLSKKKRIEEFKKLVKESQYSEWDFTDELIEKIYNAVTALEKDWKKAGFLSK
jgi:hypothetical protein